MKIDKPGVYRTASGRAVQITGVGTYLASGYISSRKMHLRDRKSGEIVGHGKDPERLRIIAKGW